MAIDKVTQLGKKLKALEKKPDTGITGKKKVDILNELAVLYEGDEPHKMEDYARRALSIGKKIRYTKGIAQSYSHVGTAYHNLGKLKESMQYHIKSLEINEANNDNFGIAKSCNCIGNLYADMGDYEKSLSIQKRALKIFTAIGDKIHIGLVQGNLGVTYEHHGMPRQALEYYFKSLKVAQDVADKKGMITNYDNIAAAYGRLCDYDKALQYELKAVTMAEEISAREHLARCYFNLGSIHGLLENHREALKYHGKTLRICEEIGHKIGIVYSYNAMGIAHENMGNYKKALECQHKSLKIAIDIGFKEGIGNCYSQIGSIYLRTDYYKKSLKNYMKSLEIYDNMKEKRKSAKCILKIGFLHLELKSYDSASTFLHKAITFGQETGAKDLVMDGYKYLCQLYEEKGQLRQALKYYKKYTDISKEIFDAEKNKQITEMSTRYETEKKEKEAEISHLKNIKLRKEIKERKRIEKELKKHRDQLEDMVDKRTTELKRELTRRQRVEKELLKHQNQLRALNRALSIVEEKQRRKTANYLHDHISQALSLTILKIRELQENSPAKDIKKALAEVKNMVAQTNQRTRSLTFEISPPILYELGLEPAVEWLVGQYQKQHGISYTFKDDGSSKPLKDEARILLFQAVRELLTNVGKHAQAQNVSVSTQRDNNSIRISVEDDGIGFNPEDIGLKITHNEGFGLFNIRERLHYLGGKIEIESNEGKGTSVILVAPLKRARKKTNRKR